MLHPIPALNSMKFLRDHWYDLGSIPAVGILIWLGAFHPILTPYQLLMWLSFVSLLGHQLEEYRIAGTFPGMLNRVMFHSDRPDRYPLNSLSAFLVNVAMGWTVYLLAALLGERAIWLGLACIMVSLGNIIAHTLLFNIKGRTLYNPGLATSWLFFAPCVYFFSRTTDNGHLITLTDWLVGLPLGVALNVIGIFKLIHWLADRNTPYIFPRRNLLPVDRLAG
jgi:hypothetical protein